MAVSHTKGRTANDSHLKPTLAEQAYHELRQLILEFALPAGAVVSERLLADRIGMGKAPIRAAVIRLAADGLVSIASRQGIVISTPTVQDVYELYQMRTAMELLIVRELAGTLRDDQVPRLRANLDDYHNITEVGDAVESVAVDFAFHRMLCEFHGNRQMARVLDRAFDTLYRDIRLAQVRFPRRIQVSAEEHQRVADAIIAGDAARAEVAMQEHLRFGAQFILSRSSGPPGPVPGD